MDPHEIVRMDQRREGAREDVVDSAVADIVRPREIGEAYSVMHRWPKRPICKAVVVLLTISRRQVDDGVLHPFLVDYCGLQSRLRSHPATPAKPEPVIGLKDLAQSHR